MLAVAGALALLMLMLAVIQSVMRQDVVDADPRRVRLPTDGVHPRRRSPSPRPASSSRVTDDDLRRRGEQPWQRADEQPPAVGRRCVQERARPELGHPAVRSLPRRDRSRDRSVRPLARDDHPRRGDLHLRLLPAAHVRRDDLARDEPLGATSRRAPRRDHPLEVRDRRDPQPRHRRDHQHQRRRTATARRSSR